MEPKPPLSRLSQSPQEDLQSPALAKSRPGLEFTSPDELLRFDASQTVPPPALEERLQRSLESEPTPTAGSWWKRLFGR